MRPSRTIPITGSTGLDMARLQSHEVVLCDVGMPGMSGLEVARRLRQDLGLRDALLVATTGYGHEDDKQRSEEAGFNAHLVKPMDVHALQTLLCHAPSLSAVTALRHKYSKFV
jgi:CheY-like chemotaxis protein